MAQQLQQEDQNPLQTNFTSTFSSSAHADASAFASEATNTSATPASTATSAAVYIAGWKRALSHVGKESGSALRQDMADLYKLAQSEGNEMLRNCRLNHPGNSPECDWKESLKSVQLSALSCHANNKAFVRRDSHALGKATATPGDAGHEGANDSEYNSDYDNDKSFCNAHEASVAQFYIHTFLLEERTSLAFCKRFVLGFTVETDPESISNVSLTPYETVDLAFSTHKMVDETSEKKDEEEEIQENLYQKHQRQSSTHSVYADSEAETIDVLQACVFFLYTNTFPSHLTGESREETLAKLTEFAERYQLEGLLNFIHQLPHGALRNEQTLLKMCASPILTPKTILLDVYKDVKETIHFSTVPSTRLGQELLDLLSYNNERASSVNDLRDVQLNFSGGSLRAHRAILMARCQYFKTALSERWRTNISTFSKIISLDLLEISLETGIRVLTHIYGGDVDINEQDTLSSIVAADMLNLPILSLASECFLEHRVCSSFGRPTNDLQIQTVLNTFNHARQLGSLTSSFCYKCIRWMATNVDLVWMTRFFGMLSNEIKESVYDCAVQMTQLSLVSSNTKEGEPLFLQRKMKEFRISSPISLHAPVNSSNPSQFVYTSLIALINRSDRALGRNPHVHWSEKSEELLTRLKTACLGEIVENLNGVARLAIVPLTEMLCSLECSYEVLKEFCQLVRESLSPENVCERLLAIRKVSTQVVEVSKRLLVPAETHTDLQQLSDDIQLFIQKNFGRISTTSGFLLLPPQLRNTLRENTLDFTTEPQEASLHSRQTPNDRVSSLENGGNQSSTAETNNSLPPRTSSSGVNRGSSATVSRTRSAKLSSSSNLSSFASSTTASPPLIRPLRGNAAKSSFSSPITPRAAATTVKSSPITNTHRSGKGVGSTPSASSSSKSVSHSSPSSKTLASPRVGSNARLKDGRTGTVLFVGHTHFAPDIWVGIHLTTSSGKNDGSVGGVRYFDAPQHHGVFVRQDAIE